MQTEEDRKTINALKRRLLKSPSDWEAQTELAAALSRVRDYGAASVAARKALRQKPDSMTALQVLSAALQLQGLFAEALATADEVLARMPQMSVAWQMRGDSLANSGRPSEAIEAYERASEDPVLAFECRLRIAKMRRALGDVKGALEDLDQALDLKPGAPQALYEQGLLHLANGDFEAGWPGYEARWQDEGLQETRGFVPRSLIPLLRTGSTKANFLGKRVLLIGDQGVGDQLMFASMIPDLTKVARSITCVCDPRLFRLFQNAFPGVQYINPDGAVIDSSAVDELVAFSGLGPAFRKTASDFPGSPYVKSTSVGVERWRTRLGPPNGIRRIGLSWRGGTPQTGRAQRSIDLQALRPLLALENCEFVSLQYGAVEDEVHAVEQNLGVTIRRFPAAELDDFQDLADLIASLHLVVSVQNATVHLTGALGKPCLAMLPRQAEWRYMSTGPKMPWYGSVSLLRQTSPGDWSPVIQETLSSLRAA